MRYSRLQKVPREVLASGSGILVDQNEQHRGAGSKLHRYMKWPLIAILVCVANAGKQTHESSDITFESEVNDEGQKKIHLKSTGMDFAGPVDSHKDVR